MKRLILSLLSLIAISLGSNAQQSAPCGASHALEDLHKLHPELKAEYDARALLNNSFTVTSNEKGEKVGVYQIPVVFHILHEYGSENVSDADVYGLMERVNQDFSATNPLSAVALPFVSLIGDAQIEFKLAAKDPLGNCTNGIERIYTHEHLIGDSDSKLNQWNRSKYLNVWVVTQPSGGATILGYALFPSGTDGNGYVYDGIVIKSNTVVGGNGYLGGTLTHEIGHYLSLPHTFGATEAGDSNCGDDGILDTPPTAGTFGCNLTQDFCNPGTIENVQNVMDYSSCSLMFTQGQVTVMHNTLEGIAGQRNKLWNDTTLIATGIKDLIVPQDPNNELSVPLCAPVADFSVNDRQVCVNQTVSFIDGSWNARIDSWEWTFEGGSPATSTSMNPSVSFSTPGYKSVTLKVSNPAGSGTESRTGYVYISPDWADISGPASIDLEDQKANWFIVNNPEENHGKFELRSGVGYNNSNAFKLGNYKNVQFADYGTDNYFYDNRLGGSVDELITPSFDLRYTTGATVSFKYAYASNATQADQITEVLKVYSSTDCGKNWLQRKSITSTDLVTAGYAAHTDYSPVSNSEYETASFNYNTSSTNDKKVRFKFEFTASDLSSNLYIDDINITGTLGLTSDEISTLDLNVYPNPTVNGEAINVSYYANDNAVTFTLRDVQGKVISNETLTKTNTEVNHTLKNTENLPAAYYFLEVQSGDYTTTRKVVVM